jgi:hypothetical protein
MMVERDLRELLSALGVDRASQVIVYASAPEWSDGDEWTDYRCTADTGELQIPITERESDVLLAAGAASGATRPFAGG